MGKTVYRLLAVVPPGLERVTKWELESLGIQGDVVEGGVEFKGSLKELYLSNLWLRSATRVLVRVAEFKATDFKTLLERVKRYPWDIYFSNCRKIKFRVTSRRSKLYHTGAIKERVIRGIESRLKIKIEEVSYEEEGTSVVVKFERDRCTISINSSGSPLYKRGYKTKETEATLRENLAAAMILLSKWDGKSPLVDPFAGAGTIPIEAAMIAKNIAPGLKRRFAFEKWKNFDEKLWNQLKNEAEKAKRDIKPPIFAFDNSHEAAKAVKINAKNAELEDAIRFKRASLPPLKLKKAWIITDPPYGIRESVLNLKQLYYRFGRWIKLNFAEPHLFFICPEKKIAEYTHLPLKIIASFPHGGLKVKLFSYSPAISQEE